MKKNSGNKQHLKRGLKKFIKRLRWGIRKGSLRNAMNVQSWKESLRKNQVKQAGQKPSSLSQLLNHLFPLKLPNLSHAF